MNPFQKRLPKIAGLFLSAALTVSATSSAQTTYPPGITDFSYLPQPGSTYHDPARFHSYGIEKVVRDRAGNFYVSVASTGAIYKIGTNGEISPFVGTHGQCGYVDGVGTAARLTMTYGIYLSANFGGSNDGMYIWYTPGISGMAIDKNDNIYVGDGGMIRKINTSTRQVERFVGQPPKPNQQLSTAYGSQCWANAVGYPILMSDGTQVIPKDGYQDVDTTPVLNPEYFEPAPTLNDGAGDQARFIAISGLVFDKNQDYLYVMDFYSEKPLRRVKMSDQTVETLIEVPVAARVQYPINTIGDPVMPNTLRSPSDFLYIGRPRGIAFSKDYKQLYFSDSWQCRILAFDLDGYLKDTAETDKFRRSQKYLRTLVGGEKTDSTRCAHYFGTTSDGNLNQATIGAPRSIAMDMNANSLYFIETATSNWVPPDPNMTQKLRRVKLDAGTVGTLYDLKSLLPSLTNGKGLESRYEAYFFGNLALYTDTSDAASPLKALVSMTGLPGSGALVSKKMVFPAFSFDIKSSEISFGRRRTF